MRWPLCLCLVLAAAAAASAADYTITDLGTLGGDAVYARGINNSGQVVGSAELPSGQPRAFLWSGGTMTNLGTFGGIYSEANGINDLGQVVGFASGGGANPAGYFGFRTGANPTALNWSTDLLDATPAADDENEALGINNAGQAVGYDYGSGFRTAPNAAINPATDYFPGDISEGRAINASGTVAGWQWAGLDPTPIVYNGTTVTEIAPGQAGAANAINDAGTVVGAIEGTAFRYSAGALTSLGTLDGAPTSIARDINASGTIVGTSGDKAFVYAGGTMTDLNSLVDPLAGWTLEEATGINDAGWITGHGQYGGQTRSFLLVPVPEPGTIAALVGCGVIGLGLVWRRRGRRSADAASEPEPYFE